MADTLLKIENLNKSFGITHANRNVCMELKRGEVRALAGENGCGKSTLLSQIAGIYRSDSGTMTIEGQPYAPKDPLDANGRKVAMVVQELGLLGDLPAGVNIFLGKTKRYTKCGIVNLKQLYQAANDELKKWNLPPMDFKKLAANMNIEGRKMIELVRALSIDPDILILDEVTQSLSLDNRKVIYKLLDKFRELNKSVIFISHDLEETVGISDTISIMRDGELLETVDSGSISQDELKQRMVGRKLEGEYYRQDNEATYDDEVVISFKDVTTATGLNNISFDVHKGEILAFCGLSDSGIREIGKTAYGLVKPTAGKVHLHTEQMDVTDSITSLRNRMSYVPKDRDGEALLMDTSIMRNMCLPSVENIKGALGYLDNKKMRDLAARARQEFEVKCTSINQNMSGLSGGNKQKINLGRWLTKDLQVLIVDCPTRGVDVGVKSYIYQRLREAKKDGLAVILITDELVEAIGMADNIIVMQHGEIRGEFCRSDVFSEGKLIEVMI